MTSHPEPDLRPSYLEHRAMRTDAERLTRLVAAARPADLDRLTALAAWYGHYEGAIHDHHTAEEAVIYPALLARDPSFAEADGELEGQHRVLADRLTVARESLGGLASATGGAAWEREQAEAVLSVEALREIVDTHTHREEDVAFSRYRQAFTAAEFTDLGKAAWKVVGARAVVFAGPWVLDHATPEERARTLAAQPLLLRLLYHLWLRPRYARIARPMESSTPSSPSQPEV
jgi:Hemerythrin HHE cation binding domain